MVFGKIKFQNEEWKKKRKIDDDNNNHLNNKMDLSGSGVWFSSFDGIKGIANRYSFRFT